MEPIEDLSTPLIAGLAFRRYQGEQDLPSMLDVFLSAERADQEDIDTSLADFTNQYRHLHNCDPYQDVLIAELNGQMVAYGRVEWVQMEASDSEPGKRLYCMEWHIRPERRGQGLEQIFLARSKQRLRQIIRQQENEAPPYSGPRLFQAHATNLQPDTARLLEEDGFQAARRGSKMTCPNLDQIAAAPLPDGLEVRPVSAGQYRQVWDAMLEAFRDHPDFSFPGEDEYEGWLQGALFQPDLWQVAWEGDQVAGMVLNYITRDPANTAEPGVAWTEDICVRPPWRRRGLARALLARSMRMFREMGFTQTSLGVVLDNPHGARQFYEAMGYRLVRVFNIYRQPVGPLTPG